MSKQPRPNLKDLIAGNTAPPEPEAPIVTATDATPEAPAPSKPADVVQLPPPQERAPRRTAARKAAGQGTLRERAKQQSVYLEEAAYEQLRELSFHERKPMHGLILEGLDLLFKKRGLKSITQLTKDNA
jgi:hypothetical protein